ncbi:MAG: SDR family oxidoreductase [Candidatus Dormibacteraeota bacterium]|uniref:SDR family oxidoreductase n=1 Tax=Candidatus Amunia macphersoniae TaxID=3127014 RepID=A0A934KQK4_9BACT|nr:SDR family oxidoreductase [Candidatus Dormibacteraeota bacterium]
MTAADGPPRRVCLLTGAGGTLGRALTAAFADRYDVAAVVRTPRPQPERDTPRELFTIRSDLEAPGATDRVVELALARFGSVDLLVNAAAYSVWSPLVGSRALLDSLPRQLAVNLAVPVQLAAALAEASWRERGAENRARNRNVVNVSSIAGVRLFPSGGRSVYAASKAALNVVTAYLAEEFAEFGVRLNALAPDSFPRRVPTETVCDAVLRLDESASTGTVVVVDAEGERVADILPG